jgi:hypothetical protein
MAPRHCLREHFLSGGDLSPAYRRAAPSAEIIKNFSIGQDQQKPFANGHGSPALFAVET